MSEKKNEIKKERKEKIKNTRRIKIFKSFHFDWRYIAFSVVGIVIFILLDYTSASVINLVFISYGFDFIFKLFFFEGIKEREVVRIKDNIILYNKTFGTQYSFDNEFFEVRNNMFADIFKLVLFCLGVFPSTLFEILKSIYHSNLNDPIASNIKNMYNWILNHIKWSRMESMTFLWIVGGLLFFVILFTSIEVTNNSRHYVERMKKNYRKEMQGRFNNDEAFKTRKIKEDDVLYAVEPVKTKYFVYMQSVNKNDVFKDKGLDFKGEICIPNKEGKNDKFYIYLKEKSNEEIPVDYSKNHIEYRGDYYNYQ